MQSVKKRKVTTTPIVTSQSYLDLDWLAEVFEIDKGDKANMKNYDDMTKDLSGNIPWQRISINPAYLHIRDENVLLELLLQLIKKGGASNWWCAQTYTKQQFKMLHRDELALIIRNLLNCKANIKEYCNRLRSIGVRKSKQRGIMRTAIFQYK